MLSKVNRRHQNHRPDEIEGSFWLVEVLQGAIGQAGGGINQKNRVAYKFPKRFPLTCARPAVLHASGRPAMQNGPVRGGEPRDRAVRNSDDQRQRKAGTTWSMNRARDFFFSSCDMLLSHQKLYSSTPSSW